MKENLFMVVAIIAGLVIGKLVARYVVKPLGVPIYVADPQGGR